MEKPVAIGLVILVVASIVTGAFSVAITDEGVRSESEDVPVVTQHVDEFDGGPEDTNLFTQDVGLSLDSQSNQQSWQTITTEYFVVEYRDGYRSDAQRMLNQMNETRAQTYDLVPSNTTVTLDQRLHIRVYPGSEWTRSDYTLYWKSSGPVRIHVQAPSDSVVDQKWYVHGLAHEYLNIVLWDHARDNADYYYYGRNPSWFSEGISEYYAYRMDAVEDQYPPRQLIDMNQTIRDGGGYFDMMADDRYHGGHLLAQYMFSNYEDSAVWGILEKDTDSFAAAVEESLGTDYLDFKRGWLRWAEQNVGGDYDLPDRSGPPPIEINVSVVPAGNTTTFRAGSVARASVSSVRADPTDVSLYYQGQRFVPNASGTASIPLTAQGRSELKITFRNTSSATTLDVDGPAYDVRNVSLTPADVDAGTSVRGRLQYTVTGGSSDGNSDDHTITFPNTTTVTDVTINNVTDATGSEISVSSSLSRSDADGGTNNQIVFGIQPDNSFDTSTVTVDVSLTARFSDRIRPETVDVGVEVADSVRGTTNATTPVTVQATDPDPGASVIFEDETVTTGAETVTQGGSVDIDTFPNNRADQSVSGTLELLVDQNGDGRFNSDESVTSRSVTLAADTSTTETLTYSNVGLAAGNYSYQVQFTSGSQAETSFTNGTLTITGGNNTDTGFLSVDSQPSGSVSANSSFEIDYRITNPEETPTAFTLTVPTTSADLSVAGFDGEIQGANPDGTPPSTSTTAVAPGQTASVTVTYRVAANATGTGNVTVEASSPGLEETGSATTAVEFGEPAGPSTSRGRASVQQPGTPGGQARVQYTITDISSQASVALDFTRLPSQLSVNTSDSTTTGTFGQNNQQLVFLQPSNEVRTTIAFDIPASASADATFDIEATVLNENSTATDTVTTTVGDVETGPVARFDADDDGEISLSEVQAAIRAFSNGELDLQGVQQVIAAFSG